MPGGTHGGTWWSRFSGIKCRHCLSQATGEPFLLVGESGQVVPLLVDRIALEEPPPPPSPLEGAPLMPSHCPPDGKRKRQWLL